MKKTIIIVAALLVLAGVGTSYAAGRYLITSTHQIEPSVLHQLKGDRGTRGARGFTGARGSQGTHGATGATGPAGLGQVVDVDGPSITLANGQTNLSVSDDVNCPAGDVVVGTGFDDGGVMTVGFVQAFGSFVSGFIANDSGITAQYNWQAICAPSASQAGLTTAAVASHPPLRSLKMAAYQKWQAAR